MTGKNAPVPLPSQAEAAETGEYKVGYRQPPRHSRFQKGEGGNRKGRRPKSPASVASFDAVLNELVTIRSGNRLVEVSPFEALLRQRLTKALNDRNVRATIEIFKECEAHHILGRLAHASNHDILVPYENEGRSYQTQIAEALARGRTRYMPRPRGRKATDDSAG